MKEYGVDLLIHQPSFSMLNRWIQDEGLVDAMVEEEVGIIPFSILSQGLLTTKYLNDIPEDSRVGNKDVPFLNESKITKEILDKVIKLNEIAIKRGQTLAEMAVSWTCQTRGISSVLLGVSKISQLLSNLKALDHLEFSETELEGIEKNC